MDNKFRVFCFAEQSVYATCKYKYLWIKKGLFSWVFSTGLKARFDSRPSVRVGAWMSVRLKARQGGACMSVSWVTLFRTIVWDTSGNVSKI